MPSNLVVFSIIMLTFLVIGSMTTGIYVAVEDKKPENKDNPVSTVTITFMMLTFILFGLAVYGGYYYYFSAKTISPSVQTKTCPTCILDETDFVKYNNSVDFLNNFAKKVDRIPRATVSEICTSEPCMNKMTV